MEILEEKIVHVSVTVRELKEKLGLPADLRVRSVQLRGDSLDINGDRSVEWKFPGKK